MAKTTLGKGSKPNDPKKARSARRLCYNLKSVDGSMTSPKKSEPAPQLLSLSLINPPTFSATIISEIREALVPSRSAGCAPSPFSPGMFIPTQTPPPACPGSPSAASCHSTALSCADPSQVALTSYNVSLSNVSDLDSCSQSTPRSIISISSSSLSQTFPSHWSDELWRGETAFPLSWARRADSFSTSGHYVVNSAVFPTVCHFHFLLVTLILSLTKGVSQTSPRSSGDSHFVCWWLTVLSTAVMNCILLYCYIVMVTLINILVSLYPYCMILVFFLVITKIVVVIIIFVW